MRVSIVSTLYNSENYILEFVNRVRDAAVQITQDFEIILVNDGSPDQSEKRTIKLIEKQPDLNIRLLSFSRNFGHHAAIKAGLFEAKGDYIFLIDSDLEEPPELLNQFWNHFEQDQTLDVVYGIQNSRKGNLFEKASGSLFYKIFNQLVEFDYPSNSTTARLMSKDYVEALKNYPEKDYDIRCTFSLAGYNQKEVKVDKGYKGVSDYTLARKLKMAVNSITSGSSKPLYLIFNFGLLLFGISIISICYYLFNWIFFRTVPEGYTSIVLSILFFGSINILFLGVISIYLSKIFAETKNRPDYIIKNRFDGRGN